MLLEAISHILPPLNTYFPRYMLHRFRLRTIYKNAI